MFRLSASVPFLVFEACGGIPDSALVVDLSYEDRLEVCEDVPEETFVCEGGDEVTIGGKECENLEGLSTDCQATVEDWLGCLEGWRVALTEDPCSAMPSDCDALLACVDEGA